MKPGRLLDLLVARTVSEERAVGPFLRRILPPEARLAASDLEAGLLDAGLRRAGVTGELARVAATWPAAAEPVIRRLNRLPSLLQVAFPLLEEVSYLSLVAVVQILLLVVLQARALPALAEYLEYCEHAPTIIPLGLLMAASAVFLVFIAVLLPLGVRLALRGQFGPLSWRRHLDRAREAALLAALLETGAPAEVRADLVAACHTLSGPVDSVEALDLVGTESVSRARETIARLASALLFGSVTWLAAVTLGATWTVYHTLAWTQVLP